MPSPSNKQSTSFQSPTNSANMNLRSSLRMGMVNNRHVANEKDSIVPFGDFRIIHTNNAQFEHGWSKNQDMAYTNLSVKEFKDNGNRNNGGFGCVGSGEDTEDDHESNMDSINNPREGSSLNVLRRREPLGASGNKPDHPKSPSQREIQKEKPKSVQWQEKRKNN